MQRLHFSNRKEEQMDDRKRYLTGMRVRREVLGDDHVDGAESAKAEFDSDFQDLITRYAWAEIWTRPGLDRHTRSLLTIAITIALKRDDELRMHLGAALRNGVTVSEIKEVLMHCAIYCGLPAANGAFHIAKEVLNQKQPL